MRTQMMVRRLWKPAVLAGLLVGIAPLLKANTPQVEIYHGRMWHTIDYDGGDGWDAYIIYQGGLALKEPTNYVLTRQWNDHTRKGGTYLMTTDWTDPSGTVWPNTVSYFFRSQDYSQPPVFNGAFNYLWPLGMKRQFRWTRPEIVINDTLKIEFEGPIGTNYNYPAYGNDPRPPYEYISDLVTEWANEVRWRYVQGVRLKKRVYSFPYGTPHQDYVLNDIVLTNDGIHGDPDTLVGTGHRTPADAPPIPTQTINHMLWFQNIDVQNHAGADAIAQPALKNDIDGKYVQPWPGVENSVAFTWDEDDPTFEGPDWGDPAPDNLGDLLLGNAFMMVGPVFVSKGPGADFNTDLPGQPLLRIFYWEKAFDLAGAGYSPADLDGQRDMAANGALQMTLDQSYKDNPLLAGVRNDGPGPTEILGYGPAGGALSGENAMLHGWNVPPGDSVRIVQVIACGGIDVEEGRRIGKYFYAQKAANPSAPDTWMTQADIDLYKTGEDTARKAVNLAYWNYNGQFAPGVTAADLAKWGIPNYVMSKPAKYNQPYNVPESPRPPGHILVKAPDEGGIVVSWGREPESTPDFDTGVNDFVGYRVWRQAGTRLDKWEMVAEGSASNWASDGTGSAYYIDATATPGVNYWYAVTAYDDGSQNWAEPGKSLESSLWWTFSGFMPGTAVTPKKTRPASVEARPGAYELAIRYNAPNPFNPSTVITYSLDKNYDRISVRVYDVLGREVKTLVDNQALAAGIHQVAWNGTDNLGRDAASGVYVARLVTPNGARSIRMLLVK